MGTKRAVLITIIITVSCMLLLFSLFVLPYIPKIYSGEVSEDTVANTISYMNFFLTLLALISTIGGFAFTIFGYYQTIKVPQMVKEEVDKWANELNELKKGANDSIKAMQIISEISIFQEPDINRKIEIIDRAKTTYPDMWILDYYKAKLYWDLFVNEQNIKYREILMNPKSPDILSRI
ncbi:hypothetical protein [Laceyella putida]|uniref:LemA family protein n=1 Tax=Laceyella putida TaxID=110101 RepID=A0ABW2RLT7_9BACL